MSINTQRQVWHSGVRNLGKLKIPFPWVVTLLSAAWLLYFVRGLILRTRSVKWLIAYIVVALLAAGFLVIPKKHTFFLICAGLSVPMYLSTVVLNRGEVFLDLTGTLLVLTLLAVVGFTTGTMGKPNVLMEPAITVPAVLYLIACLLSFMDTYDQTASVIGLLLELEMVLVFFVLVNAVRNREQLIPFLRGMYWGLGIECVIYVIQNILGYSFDILGRTRYAGVTDLDAGSIGSQRGTFCGAPATAGLYFSIWTLCLIGVYLCRRKLPVGVKVLPTMAMGVLCLALAAKRAPWIGFAFAIVVLMLLLWFHSRSAYFRLGRVLGIVAVPALALLPLILLRASQNSSGAYEERKNLTRIAWRMFEAHPIFGVGIGNYDGLKREFLPEDWMGWVYKVHNHYMLVLAETGAVGMGCYLLLHGMILWTAFKGIRRIAEPYRPFQVSVVAALIAIYWELNWDIFDSRSQNYILWFVVAMAAILPRALAPDDALGQA